jgi:hypothetical protein
MKAMSIIGIILSSVFILFNLFCSVLAQGGGGGNVLAPSSVPNLIASLFFLALSITSLKFYKKSSNTGN